MKKRAIGQHIVIDPEINNGAPIFRGTRIPVIDVLNRVANGENWDDLIATHDRHITREMIAEALHLAAEILAEHARVPSKRVLDAPPTLLGEYIVADPAICHGAVTFRGTRLFVQDIVDDVAEEQPWDQIIREWHNSVSRESIAEAVRLAGEWLERHVGDVIAEPTPA